MLLFACTDHSQRQCLQWSVCLSLPLDVASVGSPGGVVRDVIFFEFFLRLSSGNVIQDHKSDVACCQSKRSLSRWSRERD